MTNPLEIKNIGKLGEDLVRQFLAKAGFVAKKGDWKDIKLWKIKPSNNRSKVSNYLNVEVKTTRENEYPQKPRENQKESNHLLAKVRLLDVRPQKSIKFEIKFEHLKKEHNEEFWEDKLPFKEWEEVCYDWFEGKA